MGPHGSPWPPARVPMGVLVVSPWVPMAPRKGPHGVFMGPHGVPMGPCGVLTGSPRGPAVCFALLWLRPAVLRRRASMIASLVAELKPGSASLTMSLHSMEGPMLPRWIDDPTVDSAAMYSAFLSVIDSDPTIIIDSVKEDCAQLFLINHRPGPTYLPSFPRNIWCRHLGCARCGQGHGGYQFRWYHPSWVKAYLSMKRPGSWAP